MKQHPGRRLTRHQLGSLLNQAWGKSATSENAISGFRATGVFSLNPGFMPEYAFGGKTEAPVESHYKDLTGTTQSTGPSTSKTQT
ncbi:hypothetical protein WA026_006760 [Henosepilachna vigintioctopunctata]|uniref:Uncharacterized protein n=1 Tax=Henosepilachna vigintioctopunctata TaxID=420089 RepID=A0AAW1UB12_9CUCU